MQVIPAESSIPKGSLGVWYLAWPSIITNLLYATSSIFAIKIVGSLGPDAIAATVTGQRVNFILQAILTGILAGTTALDRKSTRLNSSHPSRSRMPSSA